MHRTRHRSSCRYEHEWFVCCLHGTWSYHQLACLAVLHLYWWASHLFTSTILAWPPHLTHLRLAPYSVGLLICVQFTLDPLLQWYLTQRLRQCYYHRSGGCSVMLQVLAKCRVLFVSCTSPQGGRYLISPFICLKLPQIYMATFCLQHGKIVTCLKVWKAMHASHVIPQEPFNPYDLRSPTLLG